MDFDQVTLSSQYFYAMATLKELELQEAIVMSNFQEESFQTIVLGQFVEIFTREKVFRAKVYDGSTI